MSRPPKPKSNRLYKIAGVILIVNFLVCFKSLEIMSKSIEHVVFTRETVSVVDRMFIALKDVEIGLREYLLSGTESDRARIEQLVFKVDQTFDDLIQAGERRPAFRGSGRESEACGLRAERAARGACRSPEETRARPSRQGLPGETRTTDLD